VLENEMLKILGEDRLRVLEDANVYNTIAQQQRAFEEHLARAQSAETGAVADIKQEQATADVCARHFYAAQHCGASFALDRVLRMIRVTSVNLPKVRGKERASRLANAVDAMLRRELLGALSASERGTYLSLVALNFPWIEGDRNAEFLELAVRASASTYPCEVQIFSHEDKAQAEKEVKSQIQSWLVQRTVSKPISKLSEFLGYDFPSKILKDPMQWYQYFQLDAAGIPGDVIAQLPPHVQFTARLAIDAILRGYAGISLTIADEVARGSEGVSKDVLPDGGSFFILRGPHAQSLFEQSIYSF